MLKKVIAFDLDGTLADSKSALDDKMANLFGQLLEKYAVCVISGGKYEQFETQLINNLHVSKEQLAKLHIMPTCGTRYLRYDVVHENWAQIYAEDIPNNDKKRIISAIEEGIDHFGYREKQVWGDIIEDRGSQITFSALGQDIVDHLGPEGVKLKEAWDPDGVKKHKLRDYVADIIPDYEVRVGGGTSIDITRPGIDKAYGMEKLKSELGISNEDILFIGDRLEEGGNDYPVKAMGIDSIAVKNWQETALIVHTLVLVGS
jgi:HAD superfamily hydrolase (TIGR01484 family)